MGNEVDHYVDLNVVVRTVNFTPGECIEATVRSDDGGEIAEHIDAIVLRGVVNAEGVAYFKAPLSHYKINLGAPDNEASAAPLVEEPHKR